MTTREEETKFMAKVWKKNSEQTWNEWHPDTSLDWPVTLDPTKVLGVWMSLSKQTHPLSWYKDHFGGLQKPKDGLQKPKDGL
jgi:hypothetical protein